MELEKIENKFLEVEIYTLKTSQMIHEINNVRLADKKVLIFTKDHNK